MSGAPASNNEPEHLQPSTNPYLQKLAVHLQEERDNRFPYFTAAVAFDLGLAVRARHLTWSATSGPRNPVVISISTFSGALLFQCVAGGDPPDAADLATWAIAKANTVRRFGHSSAFVECRMLATGKKPAEAGLSWPEYAVVGGAFPIYLKNAPAAPIGAITVSGLSHSDDHQLVIQTLADFIPSMSPPQSVQQSAPASATLVGARGSFSQSTVRHERRVSSARSSGRPILVASPARDSSGNEDVEAESDGAYGSVSSNGEVPESGNGQGGRAPWR